MKREICPLLFVLLILAASAPLAGVINVPTEQPTIQEGINAATAGDTVLIADGTYIGAGNRDISFGGKAITVTSVNGAEVTTIDCEHSGRGFIFDSGEGPGSILHGLTVLHAHAGMGSALYIDAASPTVDNCSFEGAHPGVWPQNRFGGGGACMNGSEATFSNCAFRSNGAQAGSGLYVIGGSDITVTNCLFEEGHTCEGEIGNSHGAIFVRESAAQITGCGLDRNRAYGSHGCVMGGSPGIRASESDTYISGCIFTGNTSDFGYCPGASGIAVWGGTSIVENCTFFKNDASGGYGPARASCVSSGGAALILRHNVFAYNNFPDASGPPISWYEDFAAPTIECNVFFDNGVDEWKGAISGVRFINDNITIAPRFCDTAAVDLHPDTLSICAPENNDCGVLIGALPIDSTCSLDCCTGYKGNINCDPMDMVDITDIMVMISREFLLPRLPCCFEEADLDNSGVVDITDLSILIDNQFLTLTPLPPCR